MTIDRQEFLARSGVRLQTLEYWLEQQWVIPQQTSAGSAFSERDIARARLIQDLTVDFGVNSEGIDVILHLIDQLHGLRDVLTQLRDGARGP